MTRTMKISAFYFAVFAVLLEATIAAGCSPEGSAHVIKGLEVGGSVILAVATVIALIGFLAGGYE